VSRSRAKTREDAWSDHRTTIRIRGRSECFISASRRVVVVVSQKNRQFKSHEEKLPAPHKPPRRPSLCIAIDPATAMTSDELEFDDASAMLDPAALARLRRVAASGKVGEEAGKEARREAAWRLGRYYSARPDGTYPPDDYDMMRQEARDLDASLKHLVAAALDGHAEASFRVSVVTALKEKYEAEEAGVLRTGNASKPFHWLRRAADGDHIDAMLTLGSIMQIDDDRSDLVKQTLKMTGKDGLAYLQKAADRNRGEAFVVLISTYMHGADGVDRDLSRAEQLLDECEKPGTIWTTSSTAGSGFQAHREDVEKQKRRIVYERLLRGGDEDAKGYSFVHDVLKITPDKNVFTAVNGCVTCRKSVPAVAELKKCKACRYVYYCSKECQRADWPRHKRECCVTRADVDAVAVRKWFCSCPGLQCAVTLAAYINRNAITVIDVRTELGDDGLHPVVTVVPKHELMNFEWGFQVSQDPRFQKRVSEGLTSDPFFFVHVQPLHLGRSAEHGFCQNYVSNNPGEDISAVMTHVAVETGRTSEVREHTSLERPPRPL